MEAHDTADALAPPAEVSLAEATYLETRALTALCQQHAALQARLAAIEAACEILRARIAALKGACDV